MGRGEDSIGRVRNILRAECYAAQVNVSRRAGRSLCLLGGYYEEHRPAQLILDVLVIDRLVLFRAGLDKSCYLKSGL